MPAVSKAQQKLMGMAYALKKGDMDPKDASQEVKDLADSMTLQQLKDYAETKHKDLPDHVEEGNEEINEWLPGVSAGHKWYTQAAQGAASYGSRVKDTTDPLIKSFIEFIESGKKPGEDEEESHPAIAEDAAAPSAYSAPQASPANTPGMGNVAVAASGRIGSGDKFGEDEDDEDKGNVGIMSYERYKKWVKRWQKQKAQES